MPRCHEGAEPDGWLEVVNWFQEGMVPAGVVTNSETLDALKTRRPILIASSFGHSSLVNSRALEIAGLRAATRGSARRQDLARCGRSSHGTAG